MAPATCYNYLMGVRSTCHSNGASALYAWKKSRPAAVYEGIARERAFRTVGPAEAFTLNVIRQLIQWTLKHTANDPAYRWPPLQRINFVAALSIAFATGLRSGELLVRNTVSRGLRNGHTYSINETTGARMEMLKAAASAHDGPFLIYLKTTKSDQQEFGTIRVIPSVPNVVSVCPATFLQSMLAVKFTTFGVTTATAGHNSPLFIRDSAGRPYTPAHFNDDIARVMQSAGIPDFDMYTAHSLREGLASACARAGYKPERYQFLFGWKSGLTASMVMHYSHASLDEVLSIQRTILSATGPQVLITIPRILRRA